MTELSENTSNRAESLVAEDVRLEGQKKSVKDSFIEWLATPEVYRSPKTQREFATIYEVSPRTLLRWKLNSGVLERVDRLVAVYARSRFADVAASIVNSALNGDTAAQRLFLANFVPAAKPEIEPRTITVKFGDEELVPFFAQPDFQKQLAEAYDEDDK